jgi:hypothetical protein
MYLLILPGFLFFNGFAYVPLIGNAAESGLTATVQPAGADATYRVTLPS